MIENIIYPNALCGVVIDDYLWFMDHEANALMKMRLADGLITEWHQIESYGILQPTLFSNMIHWESFIILLPDVCGKHIVYFNLQTGEQERINIDSSWFITSYEIVGDDILLFSKLPTKEMAVGRLNIKERVVLKDEDVYKAIASVLPENIDRDHIIIDTVTLKNHIWIILCGTGYLIELDSENMKAKLHEIGSGVYGKISALDESIIISDDVQPTMYVWNESEGIIRTISFNERWSSDKDDDKYVALCSFNGGVIGISRYSPRIDFLYADGRKATAHVNTDKNIFPIDTRETQPFYQLGCIVKTDKAYILPNAGKDFFVVDLNNLEITEIRPSIPKTFYNAVIRKMNIQQFYEKNMSLEQFIDLVKGLE